MANKKKLKKATGMGAVVTQMELASGKKINVLEAGKGRLQFNMSNKEYHENFGDEYAEANAPVSLKGTNYIEAHAGLAAKETLDPAFFDKDGTLNHLMENTAPHDDMRLSMLYAEIDAVYGRAVELLAQMADDGFQISGEHEKDKKFWKSWLYDTNFKGVVHWWFQDYFNPANVTYYRATIPFTPKVRKSMSETDVSQAIKEGMAKRASGAAKKDWTKNTIPGAYTVYNPLSIEVKGVVGLDLETLIFKPSSKFKEAINADKSLKAKLPEEMRNNFDKPEYVLDPQHNYRITREKMPYKAYATPMGKKAFRAVYMKHKLEQADLHVVNSMLSQVVTVTIGSDAVAATTAQVKALSKAFRSQAKSPILFGPHTLKVEAANMTTVTQLEGTKYDHFDEQIRSAFGASAVLIAGGGRNNFSSEVLSFEGFLANVKQGRTDIGYAAQREFNLIAETLQRDSAPEPRFDPQLLKDKNRHAIMLSTMVQAGMMSYRTAMEKAGYDFETEIAHMIEEGKLIDDGILGRLRSPNTTGPGDNKGPNTGRDPDDPAPKDAPREEPRDIKTKPSEKASKIKFDFQEATIAKLLDAYDSKDYTPFGDSSKLTQEQLKIAKAESESLYPVLISSWLKKHKKKSMGKNPKKGFKDYAYDICQTIMAGENK